MALLQSPPAAVPPQWRMAAAGGPLAPSGLTATPQPVLVRQCKHRQIGGGRGRQLQAEGRTGNPSLAGLGRPGSPGKAGKRRNLFLSSARGSIPGLLSPVKGEWDTWAGKPAAAACAGSPDVLPAMVSLAAADCRGVPTLLPRMVGADANPSLLAPSIHYPHDPTYGGRVVLHRPAAAAAQQQARQQEPVRLPERPRVSCPWPLVPCCLATGPLLSLPLVP